MFGRDGMLYMTISAPGTGPQVVRSQDPGDYAGKTIRLRDDGTVPPDNPFVGKAGLQARHLHGRPSQRPFVRRQSGDRRAVGHRAGTGRRRRDQHHQGGQELRLAGRELRPELPRSAHLGESLEGRHRAADRVLGAVDRGHRDDVLYRRSLPAVEAQCVRRRPASGRDAAHRPDQSHRVQRQVGRDSPRADADVTGTADPRRAPGARRPALHRDRRESRRAAAARAGRAPRRRQR